MECKPAHKEFFFLLIVLSIGAYGFLFLLICSAFLFSGTCSNPEIFADRYMGSGKKEYSAMKLALMLMAGSALVLTGMMVYIFLLPLQEMDF